MGIAIMAWSYPSSFYMVRHIILAATQRLFGSAHSERHFTVHSAPMWLHLTLTALIFSCNLALALCVRNLGSVMSVVGNLPSMNIAFVMPCLCFLKLKRGRWAFWKRSTLKEA